MHLTRQDVQRVSHLARLGLNDTELDEMTQQLGRVIDYVDQLAALNTDGIEPMAHAVEISGVFRADEPQPSLERTAALANAPHADGECFLVPAVLGG